MIALSKLAGDELAPFKLFAKHSIEPLKSAPLVEGVVVLVDNARKGTVKAITFTVKDTFTVVEVTLHECNMRARLDKYEITGKVFAEYINRTAISNWTPEVKQKVMAAMNQDLTNQLEKLLGQPIDPKMFKDVEFFKS